ncbi:hypothetical protein [Streptomyces eurythermus]|uniref:hypothetical protein n=1 Tax=Streptomyces eurythermus TaxID=42237 RepID=UPI0036D2C1DF
MGTPPGGGIDSLLTNLIGSDGAGGLLGGLLGTGQSAGPTRSSGLLPSVADGAGEPISQELADRARELQEQAERIRKQAQEVKDRLPGVPGR